MKSAEGLRETTEVWILDRGCNLGLYSRDIRINNTAISKVNRIPVRPIYMQLTRELRVAYV